MTMNTLTDEQIGKLIEQNEPGGTSGPYVDPADVRQAMREMACDLIALLAQADKDALSDIAAERARQMSVEGWTPEHDDDHACGEIAAFAAVYAMRPAAREWPATETGYCDTFGAALCPYNWFPKFGDRRRELVKAGALILAEIDRLDRAAVVRNLPIEDDDYLPGKRP